MSRKVRKRPFEHVPSEDSDQPAHSCVWSEALLCAFWIGKDSKFQHADNEDSDQTARMRSLIRVLVVRICQKARFLTLLRNYLCSSDEPLQDFTMETVHLCIAVPGVPRNFHRIPQRTILWR